MPKQLPINTENRARSGLILEIGFSEQHTAQLLMLREERSLVRHLEVDQVVIVPVRGLPAPGRDGMARLHCLMHWREISSHEYVETAHSAPPGG